MAAQWGNNTIAPGQRVAWNLTKRRDNNFLPIISVVPLSPSFTSMSENFVYTYEDQAGGAVVSYPLIGELGTSTLWSKLSDDNSELVYFIAILNFSNSTIEYAFLESDL